MVINATSPAISRGYETLYGKAMYARLYGGKDGQGDSERYLKQLEAIDSSAWVRFLHEITDQEEAELRQQAERLLRIKSLLGPEKVLLEEKPTWEIPPELLEGESAFDNWLWGSDWREKKEQRRAERKARIESHKPDMSSFWKFAVGEIANAPDILASWEDSPEGEQGAMILVGFMDFGGPGRAGQPRTSFRGERASVKPEVVFEEGIPAKGKNMDLLRHAKKTRSDTGYVGSSLRPAIGKGFAGKNGWLYVIRTGRGIDVNEALGGDSPFPEQFERAIPQGAARFPLFEHR